ncbi:MAG: Rv3235 family protein [Dermatophilaceae bacterium]
MTAASLRVTRSREPLPPVPLPPPISLEEAVRQVRAANAPRVPGYVQDALAVDFAAASDAQVFGPQRTGRPDLPDPQQWAGRIASALLEVMNGLRPAPQVLRWTTPEVYSVVARRGAAVARRVAAGRASTGARTRVTVLQVRICEPADGVAEAAVVVRAGDRVRAVAIRLAGQDGRWKVSALHVG